MAKIELVPPRAEQIYNILEQRNEATAQGWEDLENMSAWQGCLSIKSAHLWLELTSALRGVAPSTRFRSTTVGRFCLEVDDQTWDRLGLKLSDIRGAISKD